MASEIDLSKPVNAVKSGGVVAFPTDTFYALGVDAMNESAIRRAFEAKRRAADTPMPVLIANLDQTTTFTAGFGDASRVLAERFWPGALTIVVEARDEVPEALTAGLGTVGLRMPDHELARRFTAECDCALTGTSANISGEPPSKDWRYIKQAMGENLDEIVIGACGDASSASTVVQIVDTSVRILREGPISATAIENTLKGSL